MFVHACMFACMCMCVCVCVFVWACMCICVSICMSVKHKHALTNDQLMSCGENITIEYFHGVKVEE